MSDETGSPQVGRSVSPARLATGVVLAAWAGVFWFLILSGRSNLYLSTQTDWVIPVGAVILTLAAIGSFSAVITESPRPLRRRDLMIYTLMLVPVITITVLPPTALGSYAAARRSSFSSVALSISPEGLAEGELSLIDLVGAIRSAEGLRSLAQRAGEQVSFDGFVVRDRGMPADEFQLTRFVVSCCVADALEVAVRVVGVTPGKYPEDQWVNVRGNFYPLGTQIIVQATEIEEIEKPDRPYLSP